MASILEIDAWLRSMYEEEGDLAAAPVDWRRATGVIHVAAISAPTRRAIAIGPGAPTSANDRRVLGFARARADAIVTSGAILRAEPGLVHRYAEDPDESASWANWRRRVLGRSEPAAVVVVTRSGDVPVAHPVFAGAARVIVWTTAAGRRRLAQTGLSADWGIASADGSAADFLGAAIRGLRDDRGAQTIVLETGPRSTQGLYARSPATPSGARVDELLLSVHCGVDCPTVPGPPFAESDGIADSLATEPPDAGSLAGDSFEGAERGRDRRSIGRGSGPGRATRRIVDEPSGLWLFERYRRCAG